jgi:uncharacterized membrane protein YqiK
MSWLLGYYLLQVVLLVVILILSLLFWDKRYKKRKANGIPEGFVRTAEVGIDPQTKEKQRVYYNPDTGERIYITE